eukprot:Sspe_Gene.109679::Locus_89843_Transcript_1_1_Confidence_1.000_Length_805::g.109679::m.109679
MPSGVCGRGSILVVMAAVSALLLVKVGPRLSTVATTTEDPMLQPAEPTSAPPPSPPPPTPLPPPPPGNPSSTPHHPPPRALQFRADGTFTILLASDLHYNRLRCLELDSERKRMGKCSRDNTTALLARAIENEQPDLVVFNGDTIDENTRRPLNATSALHAVFGEAYRRGIPWSATLGNHDHKQRWLSRRGVVEAISAMPHSLASVGPEEVARGPPERPGNYIVDVLRGGGVAMRLVHLDADR